MWKYAPFGGRSGSVSSAQSESNPLLRMLSRIVFQYHFAASGLVVSMSDPARSYGSPSMGVPFARCMNHPFARSSA